MLEETKTQFTPGPWIIEVLRDDCEEPYGFGICHPETVCEETTVCAVESEADANLIAAAPDLLAACEAFVKAWERSQQLEKTDVALQMAKQAIEKVTGGKA